MQPNNTISDNIQTNTTAEADTTVAGVATGATTEAPQTTPMNPGKDIVFRDKPKKNVGAILGVILLILLAAGGAGFGTWAYLSGNQKEAELNNRISDLETQLENKQPTVIDETNVEVDGYNNPVIRSLDSKKTYSVYFSSSNAYVDQKDYTVEIGVVDGDVDSCAVRTVEYSEGVQNKSDSQDCNIGNLSGKIYKVVEFGAGHDNSENYIGFIMADGTVQYIPLYEAVENNNFNIRGKLGYDKYVVDAFRLSVAEEVGGYVTTTFVFNDGTFAEYDKSVLQ